MTGKELRNCIEMHPEVLGDASILFGNDLPFLFKVLSVRTALSIQSHPDKALAQRLHKERPKIYKDSNHKPEMAIALSQFEALCSFSPHEEIVYAVQSVEELCDICGSDLCEIYVKSDDKEGRRNALKAMFSALMMADEKRIKSCVEKMITRLENEALVRKPNDKENLVLRLQKQYPFDVGLLAVWFLNYIRLSPGQGIALAANEPHAYIHGDIVECMATSDNVIRAGLTPKLRDGEVLCSSLTYNQQGPKFISGMENPSSFLTVYRPPFDEFEVWRFSPPNDTKMKFPQARGPLIMLILRGSGVLHGPGDMEKKISHGKAYFVPSRSSFSISAAIDFVAWFAAANGMGFAIDF